MDVRYASLFENRPRTRGFTRVLQNPHALEAEAQRVLRATEQREVARRKRRAQRHGPVELARNSGEPAVQDVPSVEPWELSGYAIGAGLPDRVNGAAIASEVDDLCRLLGSLDAEWTYRSAGLKRLTVMIARQSTPTSLSHAYVDRIKDPLVVQLSDLRSSLVKDACHSIAHSVELAPMSFRPFGGFLVNAALQVVIKTTKVVKEAGDEMAQRIIRVLRAESSLVETICSSLSSGGHPVQREHSAKYLALVLSVPTPLQPLPPSPDSIDSSLLAALADPAAPVRTEARLAFKQYESNYAKQAEILFQRMDESIQRRVRTTQKKPVGRVPISQLRREAATKKKNLQATAQKDAGIAIDFKHHRPVDTVIFSNDENSRSNHNTMFTL